MEKIINKIVEFDEFEAKLTEFSEQYQGIVYDLDKPEEEQAAKSDKLAIGKVISKLDSTHKEVKADVLAKSRLIDGERKRIKDQLLSIQGDIKEQLEAHEQKAYKHAAELHDRVEAISNLGVLDVLPSSSITNVLDVYKTNLVLAKEAVIDESFESREADAALAKIKVIELLEGKIAVTERAIAQEAEEKKQAEENRLKEQAERDARIKAEAEAKAKIEAEAAKAEAAKKLEQEKARAEAEKKAAVEAEKRKAAEAANKLEQERKEKEEKEKAETEAEEKKKQNQKHRAKIHKEAKESLIANGVNNASEIVTLIKDGKIKNIFIQY